jgi:hypothetical protein
MPGRLEGVEVVEGCPDVHASLLVRPPQFGNDRGHGIPGLLEDALARAPQDQGHETVERREQRTGSRKEGKYMMTWRRRSQANGKPSMRWLPLYLQYYYYTVSYVILEESEQKI